MSGLKNYFINFRKTFKLKNFITYFIILGVIIIFGTLGGIGVFDRKKLFLTMLAQIGYSLIAALSLSLVVGFLGELSLGHAAFMSIGAFFGCYFQNAIFPSLTVSAPLLSIIIAMFIGGIFAGIFGFVIGIPALRLKGDYLAIVTLAFGEIVRVVIENVPIFGGNTGFEIKYHYNIKTLYIIIFVVLLISLIVVQNLIRSKHGRAVMAVRDNEIAARSMGVNVSKYKITVFVISAVIAGVAGVLYGNAQTRISAPKFNYNYSINILVMVVLGGMGNINGTLIAATIITYIDVKLGTSLRNNLADLKDIIYALILIVLVIYNNAPALKKFRDKYNLKNGAAAAWNFVVRLFTKKKAEHDPAKEVEFGADWSRIPTKVNMDEILSTDFIPDGDKTGKEGGGEER